MASPSSKNAMSDRCIRLIGAIHPSHLSLTHLQWTRRRSEIPRTKPSAEHPHSSAIPSEKLSRKWPLRRWEPEPGQDSWSQQQVLTSCNVIHHVVVEETQDCPLFPQNPWEGFSALRSTHWDRCFALCMIHHCLGSQLLAGSAHQIAAWNWQPARFPNLGYPIAIARARGLGWFFIEVVYFATRVFNASAPGPCLMRLRYDLGHWSAAAYSLEELFAATHHIWWTFPATWERVRSQRPLHLLPQSEPPPSGAGIPSRLATFCIRTKYESFM